MQLEMAARPIGTPKTGGRQKGTRNQRTRDFQAAVSASGVTPLEYMLAVMRDETVDPGRRDGMAKAAAPYIHPRLASMEAKIGLSVLDKLDDSEQRALAAALAALIGEP